LCVFLDACSLLDVHLQTEAVISQCAMCMCVCAPYCFSPLKGTGVNWLHFAIQV